jgi:nucleoporin POM152
LSAFDLETLLTAGDEPAAFSVKFTGQAPFSFTYTRSEQVGTKMKVVETQVSYCISNGLPFVANSKTITDIIDEIYTISSSLPGDYTVTSVSDKYCRYPPLSRAREKS